jgi:zinc transporter ZupT
MSFEAMSERWEILMVALILGAAHVISPRVFKLRKHPERQDAFSGGLSVAYVFLHLIPSLDASDGLVGPRIYFVALLGFVVFYGLDVLFQPPRHAHPTRYHAYLGVFFLYDGLMVFTLGLELPPTAILTLVFAVSLSLDVLSTDIELQGGYGARFVKSGRWVLLAGVAGGYALSLVRRPHPLVVDILTAALAGFMMFNTFKGVFPVSRNKKFPAFVAGLLMFWLLHIVLSAAE